MRLNAVPSFSTSSTQGQRLTRRMYCSMHRLTVLPCFRFPLAPPGALHVRMTRETSSSERGNYGREMTGQCNFHVIVGIFNVPQLQHGTDGFTSPPNEGVLRIFPPEKSDGFGRVRTRELGVPEASALTPRPLKPL
jgi:hypothetical protein